MRRLFIASTAALILGGQPGHACSGPGATHIDAIYPSGTDVPENQLRLYLYFTAPMAEADILPHIRLTLADGTVVEDPFLSNRFDLWSPDRTRLTLLFDPSRVKTGLDAHEELGRALEAGQSYVFTVDAGAVDASGCTLSAAFSHEFTAGPSDIDPPDPSNWVLDVPAAGTTDPISVVLGSTHDHLSMAFRIRARNAVGEIVAGRIDLAQAETVWRFFPNAPWSEEDHEISIGQELEDLAGNRPGQLFDQPVGADMPAPILNLPFRPDPN
ncbi:MAG: hypothetical protein AAGF88_01015 [Pseudomonadota bacterium]